MLKATRIAESLTGLEKRSLQEAMLSGGTRILGTIPLEDARFALPRQTFRDAVAMLMGQPLPDGLPEACPSCGEEGADLAHYLKCCDGGWVRRRHTEVLKELARLMKEVCETVEEEPVFGPVYVRQ